MNFTVSGVSYFLAISTERDAVEAPALGVLGDVAVQLRRVLGNTGNNRADVFRLRGAGGLFVDVVLVLERVEVFLRQPLVEKLFHRLIRKAQFICKMHCDLSRCIANHSRLFLYLLILSFFS